MLKPALSLFLCTIGCLYASAIKAQVTSDGTVNTQVDRNGNVAEITGGETKGGNLFHSFQDFSVPTNNEAFFDNADNIANIFSRVTGGNISNIDGIIRANGSASLFLINPAGIIFGENARLDLGGSFFGSTASSILFEDGNFSAVDNLEQPILTVNAPIGLSFRDNPGDIVNRSTANRRGLQVSSGETISLIGGNVKLNGGFITAPGGLVELGGLSNVGEIAISQTGSFNFPKGIDRSNVELTNDAEVSVAANGGGFINVNANNLLLADASELIAGIAENMGSTEARAGDININATESVKIIGSDNSFSETQTGIRNNVGDRAIVRIRRDENNNANLTSSAIGNGGAINIDTKLLNFENDGKVSTVTYGSGNAGDINIVAEDISIGLGTIESFAREGAIGNSGNIKIANTNEIFLGARSEIQTQIFADAKGNVGDIDIDTGSLILNEFSFIQADTNNGVIANAGNITIDAKDAIELNGTLSLIISQIQNGGEGNAGEISITAPNLSLSNFSLISTNVKRDTVGRAGSIFLDVDNLNITDGAVIDSLTENNFQGGNININVNRMNLSNGGKIVTSSNSGGDAGSIELNVADTISIDNNNPLNFSDDFQFREQILRDTVLETGIFASALEGATGNGGSIKVQSSSIEFVSNGTISAETQAGTGGNITLQIVDDLILRNDSLISAEAFQQANGGNLDINARYLIAFPSNGTGNDIVATSELGKGGNIDLLNIEGILGLQPGNAIAANNQVIQNNTNDIDASSNVEGFDGTISIDPSSFIPIRGVTELPTNIVVPEQTVAQDCQAQEVEAARGGLTVSGKGGVPPIPESPLDPDNIYFDDRTDSVSTIPQSVATGEGKIQPARGIDVASDGTLVLTADRTNNAGDRLPETKLNCS